MNFIMAEAWSTRPGNDLVGHAKAFDFVQYLREWEAIK